MVWVRLLKWEGILQMLTAMIVVSAALVMSMPGSLAQKGQDTALPKCMDYCRNTLGWGQSKGKGISQCMDRAAQEGRCRSKGDSRYKKKWS
jgi:hypothetical protein